jgi:hypothetical protein
MKPDTRTAMRQLIAEIRAAIPFGLPQAQRCAEHCEGCSHKLLDYLQGELEAWEQRLAAGEQPNFGDLERLARTGRKVHQVLVRNGLLHLPEGPAVTAAPG